MTIATETRVPPLKGRGAIGNETSRFEALKREAVDDGWERLAEPEFPDTLRTTLTVDRSRSIISRNDSPDIRFTASINPYRGCEHGCVYCFARPSHAWLGLSPGLDFESRLFYKPEAASLLDRELRAPRYRPSSIALGANTDPYQPVERDLRITRSVVEVLAAFNHPFGIVTKSALVLRDLDLLAPLAGLGLVGVCVSVTTLDRDLARRLEPRAATPARRIEIIRRLAAAGVPVTVLASPMIPGLNDHELEAILEVAVEAGATGAGTILLRLPLELKDLFQDWLRAHVPDRADRILSLIRQSRDGGLNHADFGTRMTGTGPYAALLARRFRLAERRLGLNQRRWARDETRFRVPSAPGDQLSLF
jgi:DNA repair photolyase